MENNRINKKLKITYSWRLGNEIKIFGTEFVKKNEDLCYIMYKNTKTKIKEKIQVEKNEDKILIELESIKPITNMSYMFKDCINLYFIEGFQSFDTSEVISMEKMFQNCKSLETLPFILETQKVTKMDYMFHNCVNLSKCEYVLNWNTSNVTDMSYMFSNCKKLDTLQFGEKWDMGKVLDIKNMFENSNLCSLFGINRWDVSNVINMEKVFYNCKKIQSLNISMWAPKKAKNLSNMFGNCSDILSIEFGNFNTESAEDLSCLFKNCHKLMYFNKDLKRNDLKFITNNVYNMSEMFSKCQQIKSINWLNGMFLKLLIWITCFIIVKNYNL